MNERRDWAPVDWSPMKRLIFLRGNPATGGGMGKETLSLTAGAAPQLVSVSKKSKVTSCAVSFAPWQEGSGDPAPDNVRPVRGWRGVKVHRTGSNIWDEQFELGNIDATTGENIPDTNRGRGVNYISVIPNETYYFVTSDTLYIFFYDAEKKYISYTSISASYHKKIPDGVYFVRLAMIIGYGTTYKNDIAVNYPSSVTTYSPYSGETVSVDFGGRTKNLCDGFLQGYYAFADGTFVSNNYWVTSKKIACKPNTNYTASAASKMTRYQGFIWYDANGNYISSKASDTANNIGYTAQSPQNAHYLSFNIAGYPSSSDAITPADVLNFQIEEGSSATQFEPYGTIYGGTVDVVTGDGDIAYKGVDLGSLSWVRMTNRTNPYFVVSIPEMKTVNSNAGNTNVKASMFKNVPGTVALNSADNDNVFNCTSWEMGSNNHNLGIVCKAYSDTDTFTAAVSGQMFSYDLTTPTPLTLPTASLTIPKGDSYIWAEMIA